MCCPKRNTKQQLKILKDIANQCQIISIPLSNFPSHLCAKIDWVNDFPGAGSRITTAWQPMRPSAISPTWICPLHPASPVLNKRLVLQSECLSECNKKRYYNVLQCNIKRMSCGMWFPILVWFSDTLTHVFNVIHANSGNNGNWRLKSFVMVCAVCALCNGHLDLLVFSFGRGTPVAVKRLNCRMWLWNLCASADDKEGAPPITWQKGTVHTDLYGISLIKHPRCTNVWIQIIESNQNIPHLIVSHLTSMSWCVNEHQNRIRSGVKQCQWYQDPLGIQCNCCCGGPSRVQSGAISPPEAVVWLWFTHWITLTSWHTVINSKYFIHWDWGSFQFFHFQLRPWDT